MAVVASEGRAVHLRASAALPRVDQAAPDGAAGLPRVAGIESWMKGIRAGHRHARTAVRDAPEMRPGGEASLTHHPLLSHELFGDIDILTNREGLGWFYQRSPQSR